MGMTEAEKKRSLRLKKQGKTGAQRVADTQKRRKKKFPTTGTTIKAKKERLANLKKSLKYK
jgi:hypothetical protein